MFKEIFQLLVTTGTWLAAPVVLLCLYDKFVGEPKRIAVAAPAAPPAPTGTKSGAKSDAKSAPKPDPATEAEPQAPEPPLWARIAYNLLPFVILAAFIGIGPQKVLGWANVFVNPLSILAVPLALLAAYDHWVLKPQRPRAKDGRPVPAPWYLRLVYGLLPFAILAVLVRIGIPVVFAWLKQMAEPLTYGAAVVGVWCLIDSWWLAPARRIAAGSVDAPDPPLTRAAYLVLPALIVAAVVRMITAEKLDFSLVLLMLSVGTALIWAVDHFVFRKKRLAAAAAVKQQPFVLPEPGTVDYSRSFFPVALVVLLVRAFVFEPYRIPSDSMMPTLLDGDFIVVNKYAYGLRWPVLNKKFVDFGSPQRGDVVVFRHPPNPRVNFIKRLVGLPGDRIEVRDDHLVINGETIPLHDEGRYTDGCYVDLRLSTETIGEHTHQVMSCRSQYGLGAMYERSGAGSDKLPDCDRKSFQERRSVCHETPPGSAADSNDHDFTNGNSMVVPPGFYVAIGDNRDNSLDSRAWGLVPEENLVGKATRIWFNFDLERSSWFNWSRIGTGIE